MLGKALAAATASAPKVYVEDVFSTFLYTGNGSTQTITNGIDLAGKGGLTWIKGRSGTTGHRLTDTTRGATKSLESNSTAAQATESTGLTSFSSTGFVISYDADYNTSAATYASWTFRKAAKFFDVVTYTGTGSNTTIAHNLGSVPGAIWVKRTNTTGDWQCYHRSLANTQYLVLNSTAAVATGATRWNSTTPTSSVFSLGTDATVNASGGTYVAYLFAHDETADGLIRCGNYTGAGSTQIINLGWEPQYVLIKNISTGGTGYDWEVFDIMRGFKNDGTDNQMISPNLADAEVTNMKCYPTATGFALNDSNYKINGTGETYIYIAIRRGPMKTPTVGTQVFSPQTFTNGSDVKITTNFVCDAQIVSKKSEVSATNSFFNTRLIGVLAPKTSYTSPSDASSYLVSSSTAAEVSSGYGNFTRGWDNTGFAVPQTLNGIPAIAWNFRRAPGFFDVVICTQTGSAQNVNHNLGVAPELLILKDRTSAVSWQVGTQFTSTTWNNLVLNSSSAGSVGAYNNYINAQPTSSVFRLGPYLGSVNDSFVAYLFATCPGVSKVGTYTGTGTTKQIDCGFTAGARFVMIKRTDSTGDWYVWDTARGIISGNDPYLLLNSTAAENTSTDYIDPLSSGFEISSTAPAAINANGGSFIFLAIS